jgi:chromosome segregation ATPase
LLDKITKMKIKFLIICTALIALSSCVPQRLMEETKAKLSTCETESAAAKKNATELEAKNAEMKETIVKEEKELAGLQRDTAIMGTNLRLLSNKYDKLNLVNDQLLDKYNRMLAGSEKDNAKLSGQLQMTQEQLLKKEDELKALELKLNKQQQDLDALSIELKKREARVNAIRRSIKKERPSNG